MADLFGPRRDAIDGDRFVKNAWEVRSLTPLVSTTQSAGTEIFLLSRRKGGV
jgi:hypothetical protein